jgi:hypothetical protein
LVCEGIVIRLHARYAYGNRISQDLRLPLSIAAAR